MGRLERTVTASLILGGVMLAVTPAPLLAQARPVASPISSSAPADRGWREPAPSLQPASERFYYQARDDRSAFRTIATHTLVGAGAGLLIGLVLIGAVVDDDHTTVVLTWTALGAAAGGLSGVFTWMTGR